MWFLFQLALIIFAAATGWHLISPQIIDRIRCWRGDGRPILATVRDDGWHPIDVPVYDALASQSPPRRWSLWNELEADAPTSWWLYGVVVSGAGSLAAVRWDLPMFFAVAFFTYMLVVGTIALVRARRHGVTAIASIDAIRGPILFRYGFAEIQLPRASVGARGNARSRVAVPWRACKVLLDRHGTVELLMLLDRRGKPVNVLAMRPAPAP